MSAIDPLDAFAILSTLREHDVEFVVIGGLAVSAHGFIRATKDVDIVPNPAEGNLRRLMTGLEDLEARPLALGDFEANEILELSLENLLLGGNWLLQTRYGRLDLLQYAEGMDTYDGLVELAVEPEIEGLRPGTLFVGLDDLIALKRAAGRDVDLLDIAELERARGAAPPGS